MFKFSSIMMAIQTELAADQNRKMKLYSKREFITIYRFKGQMKLRFDGNNYFGFETQFINPLILLKNENGKVKVIDATSDGKKLMQREGFIFEAVSK